MKLSAFITKTRPQKRGDTFAECLAMAQALFDEVIVIDGQKTWPQEFNWPLIGQHFQKGYQKATGDWVFHLDADFFFHERDKGRIRQACQQYHQAPALTFIKRQFILPDRFNVKSRLVLAVNKARYNEQIVFNGGGDLCQPTLNGRDIQPDEVPQTQIFFYNYEKLKKNKLQIMNDVGRMARAYKQHFSYYRLGGPDEKSAYNEWLKMMIGRFNKPQEHIKLEEHPIFIQKTIARLQPHQWGFSGFELLGANDYVLGGA